MPNIKTGKLKGNISAGPVMLFFPRESAPASAPKRQMVGVPINKLIIKWDIDYIYIDSAAQQTRFDFAQNYDISTINAKKSVLDGIGAVAGIVDNDQLFVHQGCKESLLCLDQYQWDPNPNLLKEKPKHNYASHMADAIRYALYSFETSATTF